MKLDDLQKLITTKLEAATTVTTNPETGEKAPSDASPAQIKELVELNTLVKDAIAERDAFNKEHLALKADYAEAVRYSAFKPDQNPTNTVEAKPVDIDAIIAKYAIK